jgi:hypothetical protein
VGALVIIAAFAGAAVALLRIADRREAERAEQQAKPGGQGVSPGNPATTVPSAGFDRQPTGGPGTTAPAKPEPTAPAPDDEGPPVVLKGDGIGAFRFGAVPDQVIAGLTLRWGPPDGDSDWIAAGSSPYGPCPGTVVRGVSWRGFTVLFSDGATPRGKAGTRHFFTWTYQVDDPARPAPDKGGNRPALKTATGVSVGATVSALQAAYGERLELFEEPPDGPQFGVQTAEGGLYGSVTGLEASGIVRTIVSGGGCGE